MISPVVTMDVEQFEDLVGQALDSIPPDLGAATENVAVVVDAQSPPGRLLGLYQGVPLTQRGVSYGGTSPDRITIYMATVLAICQTNQDVVDEVRRVVIHEVGHHFGIDDERLRELGW